MIHGAIPGEIGSYEFSEGTKLAAWIIFVWQSKLGWDKENAAEHN